MSAERQENLRGIELRRSVDVGPAQFDYVAQFEDASFSDGVMEATITPGTPGLYNTPEFDGETEEARFEAAVAEALTSEYAYCIEPVITGWTMGANKSPRKYTYDIDRYIPESPEDERNMLEDFDAYIPYQRDKEAPYSCYAFENEETGTGVLCFVLRVADEHAGQLGRWRVESRIPEIDDEDEDEDDDAEVAE